MKNKRSCLNLKVACHDLKPSLPKRPKTKNPQDVKPDSLKPKLDSPTTEGKTPQESKKLR